MKTYLVTGAAGFIGANYIKYILAKHDDIKVVILDALTYAGNLGTIAKDIDEERCFFVKGDICDRIPADELFAKYKFDYVVNFAQLTQRAGNFLVAREPIDDFSWDMLKGSKVLGGRAGGMPEMVFEYILTKNNIDPDMDLSIDQSIDFGSTAAAFSGGQGDFTIEFEPHATLLEQKGDGYVVASLGEESGYVPYTSFSAKKSYLEKNPEIIQAFTDALQKGMDYVQEHSAEEIAKCIAPQFAETGSDTLTAIVARYQEQDTWKEDLIFHKDAFDLLQNILEDSDVLKERVPYEALVTTEFAEKATAR